MQDKYEEEDISADNNEDIKHEKDIIEKDIIEKYNYTKGTPASEAMNRARYETGYEDYKDEDDYADDEDNLEENKYEDEDEEEYDNDEDYDNEYADNINDNSFLTDISDMLKTQVNEELGIADDEIKISEDEDNKEKKSVKRKILKIAGITFGVLLLFTLFLLFTKPGRNLAYRIAAKIISSNINKDNGDTEYFPTPTEIPLLSGVPEATPVVIKRGEPRQEDYVMNCLLFGIEELFGARNTDSIMIASINTKTKKISLISLMRDTYVDIPGYRGNKINSVYEKCSTREEGAQLLIDTIEKNFHIKIDAYASVNFDSMEKIVNMLGGVTIELTAGEANYLRNNNYIADYRNRNVKTGVQTLNGGQVVGYCRVRYVPTLGGANDDYGRTLRQRRVLTAIFDKYKSKGITELLSIGIECLGMIRSNITETQIVKALEMIIENNITEVNSGRLPIEGSYYDSKTAGYNGIKFTLVADKEINTKELYKLIYGDTDEEADANYEIYKEVYADTVE